MENSMESPQKKLKIELPYDSTIAFLGIHLRKTKTLIWKDVCTPLFTAALFTIAKIKEITQVSTNGQMDKKMWCACVRMRAHTHTHRNTIQP